jgi:phosphomannomutase
MGPAHAAAAFKVTKTFSRARLTIPERIPNPVQPDRRKATADALLKRKAGRRDRVGGRIRSLLPVRRDRAFIEWLLMTVLLASQMLKSRPRREIVHDPRILGNTSRSCAKAAHRRREQVPDTRFMKDVMRARGPISGARCRRTILYRRFSYCDSGMNPVAALVIADDERDRQAVERPGQRAHPSAIAASGESIAGVDDANAA